MACKARILSVNSSMPMGNWAHALKILDAYIYTEEGRFVS